MERSLLVLCGGGKSFAAETGDAMKKERLLQPVGFFLPPIVKKAVPRISMGDKRMMIILIRVMKLVRLPILPYVSPFRHST